MARGIKTGGRVHGTPNRITAEMREALKTILNNEIEILPQLLEKMKPDKRAEILSRLLPFVMPKNYSIEEGRKVVISFKHD
jgi:actin-like ATPase involved in cell morphogenesis